MLGVVLIGFLAGGRYGYGWWTNGRFSVSTDDAYVGGDITAIAPHDAGFVSEVAVIDNQHARAGESLVRLDARDFQAICDHARATVDACKTARLGLQAQGEQQLAMVIVREADVRAAGARSLSRVSKAPATPPSRCLPPARDRMPNEARDGSRLDPDCGRPYGGWFAPSSRPAARPAPGEAVAWCADDAEGNDRLCRDASRYGGS